MQQPPDRQKGRRVAAWPRKRLWKSNHPSPSRKAFPEKKGTKTNGRQKNRQLTIFLPFDCPDVEMVWWWLNGLQMSSSLVYPMQINSLHLASTDMKVKQGQSWESNFREKVSTDRASDSWEGTRYLARTASLPTHRLVTSKSEISNSHYLSHNQCGNDRCSSRSKTDLSP